MQKNQLDQKVVDFLKMYQNDRKNPKLSKLRDCLTIKQTTVAVAEITKKAVRDMNKREHKNLHTFGVNLFDVCPNFFSPRDYERALNHLLKNERMKLCFSRLYQQVGIKF